MSALSQAKDRLVAFAAGDDGVLDRAEREAVVEALKSLEEVDTRMREWMEDHEEEHQPLIVLVNRAYAWGDHAWYVAGKAEEQERLAKERLEPADDALAEILDFAYGWHSDKLTDPVEKLKLIYTFAERGITGARVNLPPVEPWDTERMPLVEQARQEWDALGMMSYYGWRADLNQEDVENIRKLIHRLAMRLQAHEQNKTVVLDPSVADWTPICESCKQRIGSWVDAIGLPAAPVEDDEPTGLVFAHRGKCPDGQ